ncbi:MAG TPA: hypothetical protein VIY08_11370 [Candidatus Nitrosocosmicus sp.]
MNEVIADTYYGRKTDSDYTKSTKVEHSEKTFRKYCKELVS